jgi:hypothetical protein
MMKVSESMSKLQKLKKGISNDNVKVETPREAGGGNTSEGIITSRTEKRINDDPYSAIH